MSLIVEGGMGSISRGGKLKELCVKTEWKNVLEEISLFNIRGGDMGVQADSWWYCIMPSDAVNISKV